MRPTIRDIAKRAGVSHTTVSRALNDHPRISRTKKDEIKRLAQAMDYVPNLMARGLNIQRSETLGVVVSFLGDPFATEILRGIENVANEEKSVLIFGDSRERRERERTYIRTFIGRRVDGLIIYPPANNDFEESVRLLQDQQIPFVLVDKYADTIATDYVVCDDAHGAYLATSHLLREGHTHIGHITGPDCSSFSNRIRGYREALREAHVRFRKRYIQPITQPVNGEAIDVYDATLSLLGRCPSITALCVATDAMLPSLFRAVRSIGVTVPQDLSLVGFGDIQTFSLMDLPITTVAYPKFDVGQTAARILFDKINKRVSMNVRQQMKLRPELIVRDSTRSV